MKLQRRVIPSECAAPWPGSEALRQEVRRAGRQVCVAPSDGALHAPPHPLGSQPSVTL